MDGLETGSAPSGWVVVIVGRKVLVGIADIRSLFFAVKHWWTPAVTQQTFPAVRGCSGVFFVLFVCAI